MPRSFHELRDRLLRAGVAPRHVRRYLAELSDHLADLTAEEESAGRGRVDAEAAALARLGGVDDLAKAMTERRGLQSWCARAPWAVFGCGSLILLAGAYLLACAYLWFLWQVFLPGADTPFGHGNSGPIYGFENICIQAGKFYYIGAPILVGWGMGLIAIRQRVKTVWFSIGLALIAWMGSTARIQASRTAIPDGMGHIRMSFFTLGPSSEQSVIGFLLILSLTLLPYLIWRIQRAHSLSA